MAKDLKEEDLKGLLSNFHYYYFDNEDRDCYSLEFHSNIKGEFQRYYNLNHVFDKIIGDKIYANISSTQVFSRIIQTIYDELNSTDLLLICRPLYNKIDKETFNNNKLLFDYSKDRDNIRLSTLHAHTTCDEHYKKVIEKYKSAYKDAYLNCNGIGIKKYDCSKIGELLGNELNKELSSLYCKDYKPHTISTGGNENPGQHGHSLSEIGSKSMTSVSLLHPATDRKIPPEFRTSAHLKPGLETIHEQDGGHILPVIETAEGGTSKTIAGSIVPVLGVSSFSLLLYKVTPVGGYINRLLGRNRNVYNSMEYMDAFNPYNEGMDPVYRRMNISYHRL
ncbi:VIR protein [Plasmodium vivax]|uniref:VIR protein n=1 Tax=Plasmodium vivax TaxID=5855 RepID=A0A1G4EB51_PLAVI|nr:VIR protein [Plasmodium vivax]